MKRVKGHAICAEGAAYDDKGRRVGSWQTTGGIGRGWCECGAFSDVLGSSVKRKAWHREHKATIGGMR